MRKTDGTDPDALYFEEGTMALWRWLGVDRFFPPGHVIQNVLRGCVSVCHVIVDLSNLIEMLQDYQESGMSFFLYAFSMRFH
jgi:polycomb protein EED